MFLVRHGQSEFNVHYNRTGIDPDIRDPALTAEGRTQAAQAAAALAPFGVARIVASPYRRALETAEIIAGALDLPVTVEALVGEWARFSCDVGSPPGALAEVWPRFAFDHLAEAWWPSDEDAAMVKRRADALRRLTDDAPDRDRLVVVSHWGFILALTGQAVPNGAVVRFSLALGAAAATAAAIVHQP